MSTHSLPPEHGMLCLIWEPTTATSETSWMALGTRLQTWLRRHQTASVLSTLAETAQDFKHMVYCTLSTQARNAQDLVVYTVRVHTNKYLVYYIIQTVHSKQYLSK